MSKFNDLMSLNDFKNKIHTLQSIYFLKGQSSILLAIQDVSPKLSSIQKVEISHFFVKPEKLEEHSRCAIFLLELNKEIQISFQQSFDTKKANLGIN
jgi:hypothetical protein